MIIDNTAKVVKFRNVADCGQLLLVWAFPKFRRGAFTTPRKAGPFTRVAWSLGLHLTFDTITCSCLGICFALDLELAKSTAAVSSLQVMKIGYAGDAILFCVSLGS